METSSLANVDWTRAEALDSRLQNIIDDARGGIQELRGPWTREGAFTVERATQRQEGADVTTEILLRGTLDDVERYVRALEAGAFPLPTGDEPTLGQLTPWQ